MKLAVVVDNDLALAARPRESRDDGIPTFGDPCTRYRGFLDARQTLSVNHHTHGIPLAVTPLR
ncbi:hypothetical protein [Actinomyces bowdenii]|uniref:Uncharacterized protein n=1 Tax=Actinomyces bowdenii TaxID=131109 RepID=A0A3P1V6L8_9ACTO|nr:hypothetical protein [Actinomyces bowdenii]RRD28283.1 hypothetical protein EII10_09485 [Actinomyces bowdenii]